jgi:hypothetical protein
MHNGMQSAKHLSKGNNLKDKHAQSTLLGYRQHG